MSTKTRKLSQILFRRSSACKKLNISTRSAMSKDDSELSSLVTQSHQNQSQAIFTSKEALNIPPDVNGNTSTASLLPNAEIPEAQQQPIKIHRRNSSSNSRNPLKEVHWSCPTLEKRREMILNYFENIMFVENNSNQSGKSVASVNTNSRDEDDNEEMNSEPIYEEIRDSHGNHHQSNKNQDTLKPKLAPKKAKFHQHSLGGGSEDSPPDLHPRASQANANIYDSLIKNPNNHNSPTNSTVIYENLVPKTEVGRNTAKRSTPLVVTWKLDEDVDCNDGNRYNFQQEESNKEEYLYATVDKRTKANKASILVAKCNNETPSDANSSSSAVTTTTINVNKGGSVKESESPKQFPAETEQDIILVNGWEEDESASYPLALQLQQQQNFDQETNINIAHHDGCEEKILPEKNLLEFQTLKANSTRIVIDTTDFQPTSYSLESSSSQDSEEHEHEEESYDFPLPPPEFLNGDNGGDSDEFGYDYDYQAAEEIIWGEIDSDSIIENKEATKFYWEKRMRAGSTSDLTMNSMSLNNNRFLSNSSGSLSRQDTKYFDDTEEDGGFESFQVANLTDDGSYEIDVENSNEPSAVDALNGYGKGEETSDSIMTSISPDHGVVLNYNNNSTKKPSIKAHYRAATFAQSQQQIPPEELQQKAATVLDLINSEISDLHMREIELKNTIRGGGNEEEVDGEDEGQQDGEQGELSGGNSEDEYNSDSAIDFESYTGTSNSSGNVTPASVFRGDSHTPNSEQDLLNGTTATEEDELNKSPAKASPPTNEDDFSRKQIGKVRPLVEEEHKSYQMTTTQETPIEREIRLSRQREEEFRKLKSISSIDASSVSADKEKDLNDNGNSKAVSAQETISVIHQSTPRKVSRNSFIMKDNEADASVTTPNKDVQYELATARLRREIEENLMREKELYREGRLKSISLGESVDENPSETNDVFETDGKETTTETNSNNVTTEKNDEHRNILPSQGKRPFGKLAIIKPEDKPMPSFSGPTVAAFTSLPPVTKRNSFDTSSVDSGSEPKTPLTPTTPLSRPSFNSIERYLLKSSFKFSIGKRFDLPSTAEAAKEPKVEQVKAVEVKEDKERSSSFDDVQEEKPRRKYIRAQDKIELELKEMMQREKELSQLRAKWKSTPDLSSRAANNSSGEDEPDEGIQSKSVNGNVFLRDKKLATTDDISVGNVSISANKTPGFGKPTVRRRQSALINRWEELIKQQQQTQ